MKKTFEYRAYLTVKQADKLVAWLEILRNLYNQALAWRKATYENTGESVKKSTQEKALTPLRQESDTVESLHIDVLQDAIDRLDKAYQAFFRRGKKGDKPGFPRFKGAGRYRSMTFKHLAKQLIRAIGKRTARVVVPKIGHVKIHYHRPLPGGKIKTLTVRRKASGWYVCIVVEIADPVEIPFETTIGIDVGLASFLTTSAGQKRNLAKHNGYCPVVKKAVSAMRNNGSISPRYTNISAINAVIFRVRPPIGCSPNVRKSLLKL